MSDLTPPDDKWTVEPYDPDLDAPPPGHHHQGDDPPDPEDAA